MKNEGFKFRGIKIHELDDFNIIYGEDNVKKLLGVKSTYFEELKPSEIRAFYKVAELDGISAKTLGDDNIVNLYAMNFINDFINRYYSFKKDIYEETDKESSEDTYLDFVLKNTNSVLEFSKNTNFITSSNSLDVMRLAKRNNLKFDLIVGDFDDYMLISDGSLYNQALLNEYLDLVESILAPYGIFLWTTHGSFITTLDPLFSNRFNRNYKGYVLLKNKACTNKQINSLRTNEIAFLLSDNSLGTNHKSFIEVSNTTGDVYYNNGYFYDFHKFKATSKTNSVSLEAKRVLEGRINRMEDIHFYTIVAKSSKSNPYLIEEYDVIDDFKYECVDELTKDKNLEALNFNYMVTEEEYKNRGYDIVKRPQLSKEGNFFGFSKRIKIMKSNLGNFSTGSQTIYAYIKDIGFCDLKKMKNADVNKYLNTTGLKSELEKLGDGHYTKYKKESICVLRNHLDLTEKAYKDTALVSFVATPDEYSLDESYSNFKHPNAIRSYNAWKMILTHLNFIDKKCNVLDLSAGIGQLERALFKYSQETGISFNFLACENDLNTYHQLKYNLDDFLPDYLELEISELSKSSMYDCNKNEVAPYLLRKLGLDTSLCYIDKFVDISKDINNLSTKISDGTIFISSHNLAIDLNNLGVDATNIILYSDVHRKDYLL